MQLCMHAALACTDVRRFASARRAPNRLQPQSLRCSADHTSWCADFPLTTTVLVMGPLGWWQERHHQPPAGAGPLRCARHGARHQQGEQGEGAAGAASVCWAGLRCARCTASTGGPLSKRHCLSCEQTVHMQQHAGRQPAWGAHNCSSQQSAVHRCMRCSCWVLGFWK